ncbi:hypothetical protein LSUB1_G006803 [Lachnellula subtilissima]|uniref:Uncharacterized protein n=1 Tax=Lachnellula subtilissima TaxID=602034 RepID=A0A8H8REE2_9HELO|nr:hypothetical protein LSUB1_G006803 [Lachnellula subtilissima]
MSNTGNATAIAYAVATRAPSIIAGSIIPFLIATIFVFAHILEESSCEIGDMMIHGSLSRGLIIEFKT